MASWYDVRDLLGHWVRPASRSDEACPHKCCRGRRPHPERFPVILAKKDLRRLSKRELWAHLNHYGDRPDADRMSRQVVGELDRREAAERRARGRRVTRDDEYRAYLEAEFIAAERRTRGNMLNRAGVDAGIDERSLWSAPEARVKKYASPELRAYFEDHPRVSRAEFLGGAAAQTRGARERRESRLYGVY